MAESDSRPPLRATPPNPSRNESSTIETERLVLRRPRWDDLNALYELWTDPIVTRHISGSPMPRRQIWTRLLASAGHWDFLGYGWWSIEEKSTGAIVGEAGFQGFVRGIDPELEELPEAGWALAPRFHGLGYASEAIQAALAWADASIEYPRTVAVVAPDNLASVRVAEKAGYRESRRTTYLERPIVLFERERRAAR